jgi:hypothetical protein
MNLMLLSPFTAKECKKNNEPSAKPAPTTALEAFIATVSVVYNGLTLVSDYATLLISSRFIPEKLLADHWCV